MKNPKISAAKSARAEYRQKLKRLAVGASIARDIYSQAMRELAIDKFINLHPQENWPEWMEKRAEFEVQFDESNICKVSIIIRVDGPMPENHFWTDSRKKTLAVRHDNGEIGIIICIAPSNEFITIFEADVDPESLVVSVIVDRDPSKMVLPPPEFFYDGW
jgi:hypothetical protein